MKKTIALILCFTLVGAMFAFSAAAADEITVEGITFEGQTEVAVPTEANLALLIDGNTVSDAVAHGTAGVVLINNTNSKANSADKEDYTGNKYPTFSFTLELSEKAKINGATISYFVHETVMIGLGTKKVAVEFSDDGVNFAGSTDYEFTTGDDSVGSAAKVQNFEITGINKSAKYVKFTFQFGDSPWETPTDNKYVWEFFGFTEIAVDAAEDTGETSSEDESSADVSADTSSSTSSSTTPTGDAGYIALAVIAMVALAGAVIVKKVR